jgi:hypothetical protein
MVQNVGSLLAEFTASVGGSLQIRHELLKAPHVPPRLPARCCAVYVFSLAQRRGEECPAGPNRVLKVGSAGPNSNARFQSQHYHARSSGSNLAKSLLTSPEQWKYLGIVQLSEDDVKRWITDNLDRDQFFLDESDRTHLRQFERFLRARLSPVFEG